MRSYLPDYSDAQVLDSAQQLVLRGAAPKTREYARRYLAELAPLMEHVNPYASDVVRGI